MNETRALIHRYFDGALDEAGLAELDARLSSDAGARDCFVEMAHDQALLMETLRGRAELQASATSRRRLQAVRVVRRAVADPPPVWIGIAAAAAVVLALAAAWSARGPKAPAPGAPPVAAAPKGEGRGPAPRDSDAAAPAQARPPADAARKAGAEPPPADADFVVPARPSAAPAAPAPASQPPDARPATPPAPAEPPPAPPAPAPTAPVAAAVPVAQVERVEGTARVLGTDGEGTARPGLDLLPGQGLKTAGAGSAAVLRGADGVRMELGGETSVESLAEGGRRVTVAAGTLVVDAARQPPGRPVVFVTPHAEARVLGTRFTLAVSPAATRLEVRQGRVRFVRRADGASVDVGRNQEAVAGADVAMAPAARPLPPLAIAFQDGVEPTPAYAGTRDTNLCEPDAATALGRNPELKVYSTRQRGQSAPALLLWDVSALPPGATVVSASVTLHVVKPAGAECGDPLWTLYELRRPWAEAEATWRESAAGKPWQAAGARGEADRGAAALGAAAPAAAGPCVIPLNANGLALLQGWIGRPASNRGLIVIDDRSRGGAHAASREAAASQRPRLTVQYNLPER
jgi:ferric-dicitrate binding protein FerR (iron transport regulator)